MELGDFALYMGHTSVNDLLVLFTAVLSVGLLMHILDLFLTPQNLEVTRKTCNVHMWTYYPKIGHKCQLCGYLATNIGAKKD